MFWKFNIINTLTDIDTLLKKENVTLKELMDEENILQECKAQAEALINFLVEPKILTEMVQLITQEPTDVVDESIKYKYANIACELLTSDVSRINNALASSECLLNLLYSFLDSPNPLNPLLASFFSKTLGLLVSRNTEIIFSFLKKKEDFVPRLINHFNTSAIMDLLLRFISGIDGTEQRYSVIKWLNDQKTVEHLVGLISPEFDDDFNCNAAYALCDIIKVSREQMSLLQEKAQPDPILESIESPTTITLLLENMLRRERKECTIVNGISVLLSLLEFKKRSPTEPQLIPPHSSTLPGNVTLQPNNEGLPAPQFFSNFFRPGGAEDLITSLDVERLKKGILNVLESIHPFLVDFHDTLLNPPKKTPVKTTFGTLDPPLGATRLEIAHLHNALLNCNSHEINEELAKIGTLPLLLDLFFKYPWNNFLHTQVEQIIGRILENEPTKNTSEHPLLDQLFSQCRIIQRILDNWVDHEESGTTPSKKEQGYMGHLTSIANHIAQNKENQSLISQHIKDLPDNLGQRWESFVAEKLAAANQLSKVKSLPLPSTSDELGLKNIPFAQDALQQFGFADEFPDTEEHLSSQISQLSHAGIFHFSSDSNLRNAELFEQACKERSGSFGEDSDEDVWEEKEHDVAFSALPITRQRSNSDDNVNSSDSEEDPSSPQKDKNVLFTNPLPEMDESAWDPIHPLEVNTNPWETTPSNPTAPSTEMEGWADFSSAPSGGFDSFWSEESNIVAPFAYSGTTEPSTTFLATDNITGFPDQASTTPTGPVNSNNHNREVSSLFPTFSPGDLGTPHQSTTSTEGSSLMVKPLPSMLESEPPSKQLEGGDAAIPTKSDPLPPTEISQPPASTTSQNGPTM